MLAFYSGNYDHDNLTALHHAVVSAQLDLPCQSMYCTTCPHSEACADLFRLERYISRKIGAMEVDANE